MSQDRCLGFYVFMSNGGIMNIDEASRKYCIPIKILKEYENMELCGNHVMGAWQYNDQNNFNYIDPVFCMRLVCVIQGCRPR